ncbi:hypothetical protein BIV25_44150 [Streptomyces sp. MUSC 14]|nr:hypothetical protein BIV25_44150 [Streptomyces sp. MUSC 14]
MRLVYVAMTCKAAKPVTDPEVVNSALRWADHEHGALEHARIHMSRTGACAVLFINSRAPADAQDYCRKLVIQALDGEPALAGWSLSECTPLPSL